MTIQNLSQTPLPVLVECLLDCFSDYFVPFPTEVAYWEKRFRGARVDFELSYGAFEQGELVAFIINGVDAVDGRRVAFNTGTGVRAPQRGQQLVDQLYAYAVPRLQAHGIQRCQLEVIQENARAIRVYERIGFHIKRRLLSYKGTVTAPHPFYRLKRLAAADVPPVVDAHYPWDHKNTALAALGDALAYFEVYDRQALLGHLAVDLGTRSVKQWEGADGTLAALVQSLSRLPQPVAVVNVDAALAARTQALSEAGLDNFLNQYEMEWDLP